MVRISEVEGFWLEDGSPKIMVSGSYLKDFGFEVGSKVVVEVTKGQVVIKLVDAED